MFQLYQLEKIPKETKIENPGGVKICKISQPENMQGPEEDPKKTKLESPVGLKYARLRLGGRGVKICRASEEDLATSRQTLGPARPILSVACRPSRGAKPKLGKKNMTNSLEFKAAIVKVMVYS